MKKPMLIEENIRIKAYEIDAMGIVSNIVYIKWFEDLRHLFLDKYFPYGEMLKENMSPILRKTEVHYKTPLTIQDAPTAKVWVSTMGKIKWQMTFLIESNGKTNCTGTQEGCIVDIISKRPILMPKQLSNPYSTYITK
jgi:acyl-CoA thioester hydrolase